MSRHCRGENHKGGEDRNSSRTAGLRRRKSEWARVARYTALTMRAGRQALQVRDGDDGDRLDGRSVGAGSDERTERDGRELDAWTDG